MPQKYSKNRKQDACPWSCPFPQRKRLITLNGIFLRSWYNAIIYPLVPGPTVPSRTSTGFVNTLYSLSAYIPLTIILESSNRTLIRCLTTTESPFLVCFLLVSIWLHCLFCLCQFSFNSSVQNWIVIGFSYTPIHSSLIHAWYDGNNKKVTSTFFF